MTTPGDTAHAARAAAAADQRDALAEVFAARIAADADALATERSRADAVERELAELRATRSHRCARALSAAHGRPAALLALPWTLFRIATTPTPAPVPAVAAAMPAAPAAIRHAAADGKPPFRVAAIVDEFTALGLRGECELLLLTPTTPADELDAFAPDLLLVESAWSGPAGAWRDALVPVSDALLQLLLHCRRRHVPTVFWNKEDPSHYGHFLAAARHFDHVLTSDAACIDAYRRDTGRTDVGVLQFACQPRLHHPVESAPREDAFLFAGSHYRRYPDRMRDFARLVEVASALRPVHIYDRNAGTDDDDFRFPAHYGPMLRGGLAADAVHDAYRRYRYAINVNSITGSPTMLSRRVFELLACNTLVVSNESPAMRRAFGDAVVVDPDVETLRALLEDPAAMAARRRAGLRAVMSAHTWGHRLAELRALIGRPPRAPAPPPVRVVARAGDDAQAARLLAQFDQQTHADRRMWLVADADLAARIALPPGAELLTPEAAAAMPLPRGEAMSAWSPADAHGPSFLADLALTWHYARVAAAGQPDGAATYRMVSGLPLRGALVFDAASLPETVGGLLAGLDTCRLVQGALFAADGSGFARGA